MMYGEELSVHASAQIEVTATTAFIMEHGTGNILTRQMFLPGQVVYWGYKPTVAFQYDGGIAVQGYLGLYRETKTILPATVVNAAGLAYAVGDLFTIVQAGGSGGVGRVLTITPATGAVLTVEIVTPGVLYAAGAATTVALNGAGNNALTLTIVSKKLIDTIALEDAAVAGKQYMRRVPNAIGDASPSGPPPAHYNAGEDLLIDVVVMAVSTGQTEVGDFQVLLVTQNRAENFAAQGMWVEGAIGAVVSPAVPNY